MARVLAFPPACRRDLVRKQARWFAEQSHHAAERNLRHQLCLQHRTLLAKGVDPDAAQAEIEALEQAIRAEVWRVGEAPGGAA